MKPLIFLGSRLGMSQLATVAEALGYEVEGILDFQYYGNKDTISNIPVIGNDLWLLDENNTQAQKWLKDCDFFVANFFGGSKEDIKNQILRTRRIQMLERLGIDSPNLIHPSNNLAGLTSKYTDKSLKIGKGNFFDEGVTIHQDNVTIGDYCCLTWGVKVSHDTVIGNNVSFAPNCFYQFCDIGNDTFLGYNSEVSPFAKNRISIGNNVVVWAKSSVLVDVPDNSVYTHKDRIISKRALYKNE